MTEPHSASAEKESLKLVEDFVGALTHALDSLGDVLPNTILDNYRLWSSNHLQRAVSGFAFLRRRGLVDSSKFLIRPAIEMMIRVEAARQHPDLFYRIAHAEHRQDKHLLRIADQHQLQAYDGAQSEKV
jgi:hypothetical protein